MNRQIGVGDSKYVIVFDPLFTGHVIRRMHSGRVRISNANQWATLSLIIVKKLNSLKHLVRTTVAESHS